MSVSVLSFTRQTDAFRRFRRSTRPETPAAAMSNAGWTERPLELCEDGFNELAENAPLRLMELLQTELRERPELLTFAAESMGRVASTSLVLRALLPLLHAEQAIVREGAVYGLMPHLGRSFEARDALRTLAEHDLSPGVRSAAKDALAQLD